MENKFKILILVVLVVLLNLTACEDNTKNIIDERVSTISKVRLEDLDDYKDTCVGNNSAIGDILQKLPANIYNDGFSLKTEKEPYGIMVNYDANHSLGREDYNDFWSDKNPSEFLEKNAVVLLALIKNVEEIEFKVKNIEGEVYKYNRKELEKKYGEDLKELLKDQASFEKV
ncbi:MULTISPECIES: DUF4825 domain-containing protein [Clostridium]|uniref:DUF4825 domain-containing protein n=1 Tax=Clostridium cibarium TaxID=2762247 RepID=A0ABR8PXA0_9CLOT|nr:MULTISPECIES: DUF4825 domain-containing protein [Clostridium]MBD7912800.1 DUF4825 domain-containing protein [Clostridium cibarium]